MMFRVNLKILAIWMLKITKNLDLGGMPVLKNAGRTHAFTRAQGVPIYHERPVTAICEVGTSACDQKLRSYDAIQESDSAKSSAFTCDHRVSHGAK